MKNPIPSTQASNKEKLEAFEKLQTINVASEAILIVCKTFNSSIEDALPLIIANAKRIQNK